MSKGLEELNILYEYLRDEYDCRGMKKIDECKDAVEKELKAFEIIKDFVWMENGEIHLGVYGDVEITLGEDDFESKEKYDLLKEKLE